MHSRARAHRRPIRTTGTPRPIRLSSTLTPAWSSWSAGPCRVTATTPADGGIRSQSRRRNHDDHRRRRVPRAPAWVVPHRRPKGEELPAWKEEHNRPHKQDRARVEHLFARRKSWKILRDCRLKGDGVHHAMLGIARLHNLNLAGWAAGFDLPSVLWIARGSRHGETPAAHLLAAITGAGLTVTSPSCESRTRPTKSPASPPCWSRTT
ncbi:transposase [Streptomyces inhibens]|uniref:transposase n=1 Tax=Streptomyces inhibens TaxID=2293571 RepID=UPI003CC9B5E1